MFKSQRDREREERRGGNGKYLFFFTPALSLPLDIVFGSVERNEMKKGKLKSRKSGGENNRHEDVCFCLQNTVGKMDGCHQTGMQ